LIQIRRANERGHAYHGWLDSFHTFSFAGYHDPEHMGFRSLRVINEDRVDPGNGFPTHGHRDMEIVSYVLEGAIEHEDSLGQRSVLRPGEIQRMSAGTGIMHSEYNASQQDPLHFLQIWIIPEKRGLAPSYEQKAIPLAPDALTLLVSPDGAAGSLTIHQDARIYGARLSGGKVEHALAQRHAWIQVARGTIDLNGHALEAGDGAAVSAEPITIAGDGEILLFDLA
jgi:redox-sensitive bicupin YhaK (pirin superfamily)